MSRQPIYITTQNVVGSGEGFSSLFFDAVHNFVPTFTSRLTKYAISDKSEITNHITKENVSISMQATVTQTPTTTYQGNLAGYSDFKTRAKDAYDILHSWWNNKTDLFIDEGNRQYSRMQITNLQAYEEGYDSIKFDIMLEQARRVGYQRVTLIQDNTKTVDSEPENTKKGEKVEERTSQLSRLTEDLNKRGIEALQSFARPEPEKKE